MTEKMITSGGAEICTGTFGDPSEPPVLLIMGQMASMLWWPADFCDRLANGGRFVLRYDNRDTGRSTGYEPGEATYTLDDLAGDAIAVLDGYDIERAHLVGMSLGGGVAQLVALEHPARVASVTAISTTKVGEPDPSLPGPDPGYMEHAGAFEDLDWSDTQALGDLIVEDARQVAGSRHPFDEAAARDLVTRDLERARNPQSLMNHGMLGGGEKAQDRLGEIAAPFLVIHGSADPIFPHQHGVALAEAVGGAELVTLEGGGHELNQGDWDQILDAILSHTGSR
ncbi:MAG TPA: alpha/beta hydrolase [Thermoleophilaceae bacterium]|nr:alpha/beta hydrolase [Thermoleophilaceae bacterium]